MSLFDYVGRDAAGHRRRGVVEADTPKSARIILDSQGILTEKLAPATGGRRLRLEGRARLYRELGTMLQAGFTLDRSLGMLLGEGQDDPRMRGALAGLRDLIRDGLPLSRAMTRLSPGLPAFERTALAAAEQAGMQGAMLVQLAGFLEAQAAVTGRLRDALLYPSAVMVLALTLLSLMMFVVLPKAASLFSQFGDDLPASTRLVAVWGPRLMFLALLLLAGGVLTCWRLWRASRRDAALAGRVERLLLRLPALGAILPRLWSLRFAGTMSLLIEGGVTPQEALSVAGTATGSQWLSALMAEQAAQVRQGASLSSAVAALPPLAPHLAEWVRVGEAAGNLGEMLRQASDRSRQGYESRLTRLLGLLEPALILIVGLAVLLVAHTVLKPMLDLARLASG